MCFESTQLYVPAFTQKDFQSTKSSIKDFPHREPPLRILGNTTRRTHLLSPTSTQEAKAQSLNTSQQPPHHKRGINKPRQPPRHKRGINKLRQSPPLQWRNNKMNQSLQLSDLKDHKLFFLTIDKILWIG